jgi:hypothetical protein
MPRSAQSLVEGFRGYFRAPTHAINLAVFRIVVFGWLLLRVYQTPIRGFEQIPAGLRVAPPGYAPFFELIPFGGPVFLAAFGLGLLSCGLALVGCFTRGAALVGCLCCVYLLGLPEFFGKVNHVHHHLIWFSLLLALSPCGDALSVDAVVRAWRGRSSPPTPSHAYALPIRIAWLLLGVAYFFPGLAKLSAGSEWFLSDNLRNTMYGHWAFKDFVPGFRIDQYPLLIRAAALGTILFELGFVFLIFVPRLRPLLAITGICFHAMIWYTMRIDFSPLMWCYASFVDWYALSRRIGLGAPAALKRRLDRFFRPRRASVAGAAPPGRAALVTVGSMLVLANLYCGARGIDSWPFSVYPRFGSIQRNAARTDLEIVVERTTGQMQSVASPLRRSAMWRLARAGKGDPGLDALTALLVEAGLELHPGDTLRLSNVTRSTVPEESSRDPLREEILLEWSPRDR